MKNIAAITISVAIFLFAGCTKENSGGGITANTPQVVQEKSTFDKIKSEELQTYQSEAKSFIAEVCKAIGATPRFDSGARRSILKDYGFDLSTIADVEAKKDQLWSSFDGYDYCPSFLPLIIAGKM